MAAMSGEMEWVYRTSQPDSPGSYPVILMLHGWTGDENSMWIFTSRLPDNRLIITPRGIYPAVRDGYAWHTHLGGWPQMMHFRPSVEALLGLLTTARFPAGDFSELHLIGFSQGAALAYTFTLMYPERVASLSALSGFMPLEARAESSINKLYGLPVFITHGSQDTLVPVERARQAAEFFDQAGAMVTYCEHEVGHKLNANCFRGLEAFHRALRGHEG